MRTRLAGLLACLLSLGAAPASAQGLYISASATADIIRFSRATSPGVPDLSGSGEAAGVALRLGAPIGVSWGVEAEFARPAEVRQEGQPDIVTLASSLPLGELEGLGLLPFTYSLETAQRTTTVSTSAWVLQQLSQRVALAYVGGLGFARTARRSELTFAAPAVLPGLPGLPGRLILPPVRATETVEYGVRPLVGVEGRITLTERFQLVPGIRLMGMEKGWLIRPAVGLGWLF